MVKDVAVTDAAGERNYKLVGATVSVSQNGNNVNLPVFDQQTLYASPLITITDKGYTKHYFEEGNRICSSIGSGGFSNIFQHTSPIVSDLKEINRKTNQNAINTYKNNIGVTPYIDVTSIYPYIFYHRSTLYKSAPEAVFYYHTDHLGSATLVTDDAADVVQQIAYLPYGEDWVDIRHHGYFGSAYKFNGKEKDDETGYSYYGARYYTDRLSIWLSVDPLADKYPHLSPYAYCADNPVMLVDPDGRDVVLVVWASHSGKIGHAGIAISNYRAETKRVKVGGRWTTQTKMVPDGTYTYRDLWPREGVDKSSFNDNVPALYNNRTVTLDQLLDTDVTGSEGYAADGVIQFTTDFDLDKKIQQGLNDFEESNPSYNGLKVNCSDYVEKALETMAGKQLPVDEKLTSKTKATTPNQVYKNAATLKNGKVLKDAGSKVNNGFIKAVTGGGITQKKQKIKLIK